MKGIKRAVEVYHQEGVLVLVVKLLKSPVKLLGPYSRRPRRYVWEFCRIEAPITVRWLLKYAVSSRFRYMVSNPVAIVGCGHSGTTLLLKIISAHSIFYGINEKGAYQVTREPTMRKLRLLELYASKSGKARWIDKTPAQAVRIGEIFRCRPKAKIILVIRDGRDVALSVKHKTGDFSEGVRRWIEANKAGQEWWDHPMVLIVRYESLIADLRSTVETVLSFLGEGFEEECYRWQDHYVDGEKIVVDQPVHVISEGPERYYDLRWWQVQQPLYDGRGRWRTLMTDAEKDLFKKRAGDMLIEYKYAQDSRW